MSEPNILPPPNHQISYGADSNQFGHLRIPKGQGPHPVVIFIHGGFWRAAIGLERASQCCAALTESGHATWNLEYRRIGQPGGGWPGTLEDVRQAALLLSDLADKFNLDLSRVVVAGHSAGGHLALWLAAQGALPLQGVAALAPVADLRQGWQLQLGDGVVEQFLAGTPEQVPERYAMASPYDLLPTAVPQRLFHGTADEQVPFAMTEAFAQKSRNATLIALPGTGHNELIDPQSKEWPVVHRGITRWDAELLTD